METAERYKGSASNYAVHWEREKLSEERRFDVTGGQDRLLQVLTGARDVVVISDNIRGRAHQGNAEAETNRPEKAYRCRSADSQWKATTPKSA
jgi:hypothetical protein